MNLLVPYMIKSVLSVGILYVCYQLLLKREAIFSFNRLYLLFSLFIASLLPFFHFDLTTTIPSPVSATNYLVSYPLRTITLDTVYIYGSQQNSGFSWIDLITVIYFSGVFVKLLQFIFRLAQILVLSRKPGHSKGDGYRLLLFKNEIPVFSFFNMIFMGENIRISKDIDTIIRHEKVHINQLHSLDLILAEILIIVQWFNPFAYLLKKSIKENHEFIADNEVVSTNIDQHNYKILLIKHSGRIKTNALSHNFSYSLLKRRLQMINKPKRPSRTLIGIFGALLSITMVVFACSTPSEDMISGNNNKSGDNLSKESPAVIEVNYGEPNGMDSLKAYVDKYGKWPDKIVVVGGNSKRNDEIKIAGVSGNNDTIYAVVEHMPEFPGGIDALMKYLANNIKYPEQAKKDKIQGKVFINFIVEKDGSVSNVKILRGVGGGCDDEAVRVVENMPAWKPGKNDSGETVRVSFNLPIRFALN